MVLRKIKVSGVHYARVELTNGDVQVTLDEIGTNIPQVLVPDVIDYLRGQGHDKFIVVEINESHYEE